MYKKDNEFIFLNHDEAIAKHNELLKFGYTHISTMNPAILLGRILEILNTDQNSELQCNNIYQLITDP